MSTTSITLMQAFLADRPDLKKGYAGQEQSKDTDENKKRHKPKNQGRVQEKMNPPAADDKRSPIQAEVYADAVAPQRKP